MEKEKDSHNNIRVVACPQPFSTVRVERSVPAGKTLSEIVSDLGVRLESATDAHVMIGDIEIKRKFWPHMRPKAGSVVTVRVVPRGGNGKSFLRIIIGIAGAALGGFLGGTALIPTSILGVSGIKIGSTIGGMVGFLINNATDSTSQASDRGAK